MKVQHLTRLLIVMLSMAAVSMAHADAPVSVQVYKSPTCGCCDKWVEHMRDAGFSVTATDVKDVDPIKRENGIPARLASCHTAFVEGYLIEGHVPASDIRRLLKERPPVGGLAVPKMPMGSPGMEGPNAKPYDVLTFDSAGKTTIYSTHKPSP